MPRVSVVMPCFNSGRYLGEAVSSILDQTLTDLELIVVLDTGSADGTEQELDRFDDIRLRVVRNDPPLGLVRSLNRGFALADGGYIARMDADDVSAPDRLERQASFLDGEPSVGIVGSAVRQIDGDGGDLGVRRFPTTPGLTLWRMHLDCAMCHPATMFRKSVFQDIGGYSPSASNTEDYDLWLRAMRFHDLTNLPDILLRYRIHQGSVTQRRREEQRSLMVSKAGRAIDITLGRPVDRDFVRCLLFPYTIESRRNAIGAAWLLAGLRRSYMMWYKARTWEDTLQVKREVAVKMSHIMTRAVRIAPTGATMVAWQASRCGPGVAIRLGNQMLKRGKDVLSRPGDADGHLPASPGTEQSDNGYMHPP